ncbi:hypothetical protein Tco_1483445 [Tanacetum coccineum]
MVASLLLFHCRNVVRRSRASSISSWSRIPRYGEDAAEHMKMRSFSSSQRKQVEEDGIIIEEDRLAGTKLRKTRDGKITEVTKYNLSEEFHKKYLPRGWRRWLTRVKDFLTEGGNRGTKEAILKGTFDDAVGLVPKSVILYKTGVAGAGELCKGIDGFVHRDKEVVFHHPGLIKDTILITLTVRNVLVIEAIEEDGGGARILRWNFEEDLDFEPALFKAVYVDGDIRILVTRYGIRAPRQFRVIN